MRKSVLAVGAIFVLLVIAFTLVCLRTGPSEELVAGWQTARIPSAWQNSSMPPTQVILQSSQARDVMLTLTGIVVFRGVISPDRGDLVRSVRLASGEHELFVQDAATGQSASKIINTRLVRSVVITFDPVAVTTSDVLFDPL